MINQLESNLIKFVRNIFKNIYNSPISVYLPVLSTQSIFYVFIIYVIYLELYPHLGGSDIRCRSQPNLSDNIGFTMFSWVYYINTRSKLLAQNVTPVPISPPPPPCTEVQSLHVSINCGLICVLTLVVE